MGHVLEGIRVVDLTEYLAGPYCTMMLADLGADVVKVEQPSRGDGSRQWRPPFIEGESGYFLSINRNKKSITLNLKSPKGLEVLHKLVSSTDVFIENYRPGIAEKLGVDYAALSRLNEKLVYCSISGFGQDGPYSKRPLYDIVGQAMSGFMSITGEEDRPPVKIGIAISDICGGMFATIGILAALKARDQTGQGRKIDVSIIDGLVSWLSHQAGYYFASGLNPERLTSAHPTIAPYQAFKASDVYFVVAVGNDILWKTFCEALGISQLIVDPRFLTNPDRVKNRNELTRILQGIFATKPANVWLQVLDSVRVPCGPVQTVSEVFTDPQVLHREMLQEINHPKAGKIKVLGVPIKMDGVSTTIRAHPPMLGEHTIEVLHTLGYSDAEIKKLEQEKAV